MNIDIRNFARPEASDSPRERRSPNVAELQFKCPFTCMIAGPTQSGKTCLTSRILKNSSWLYSKPPNDIFYFYNSVIPTDDPFLLNNAHFVEGLPDIKWLEKTHDEYGDNITVVIDDQALHITEDTAELFTVGCSRFKTNIIFITQNLYFGSKKGGRDLTKNIMYLFLMRNPREENSLRYFCSQQVEPTKELMKMFKDICHRPYSYMFINFHQTADPKYKYMYNLFGEDKKILFPRVVMFQ